MYLNKSFILGNLTRDPELKALPSGSSVASFSLATNRVWKDKDGRKQEEVEYHNIIVFGKQADNCAQYLRKGSQALVEGRIQTRSWEKDGKKNFRTEIVADTVQFGNRPVSSQSTSQPASAAATENVEHRSDSQQTSFEDTGIEYPANEIDPNDIPF